MISSVAVPGGGRIGMTICPGRRIRSLWLTDEERDLSADLRTIVSWPAAALVTLVERRELEAMGLEAFGQEARALGLEWHHLPIRDMGVPNARFEDQWQDTGPQLRRHLRQGRQIVLHCLAGLGRTGTIAARLLIESGITPGAAITLVRTARPGAIQSIAQERYASRPWTAPKGEATGGS